MSLRVNIITLLALFTGTHLACAQKREYRCPPCPFDCHQRHFDQPGLCPICEMTLVELSHKVYEAYSKEEILITNPRDGIKLNTAFYTPESGKMEGILIVAHGSAPTEYEDLSYYINIGTKLNMGVLAFDKRGVGKSGGKFQTFNVEQSSEWINTLASDILACVSWIESKPELSAIKIGLIGGSQAGWIMPLAASQNQKIYFMIIGEGVSVSAGEENFFSELSGDGDTTGLSIQESDLKLKSYNGNKGYDPRSILQNTSAKTLWFFGTKDAAIPVDASIRVLDQLDNPNFTIQMLENSDHNFNNVESGERIDLLKYIRPWLKETEIIDE